MSRTASLARLRWYSASNLCMAASCSSVIVLPRSSNRSSCESAMTPLAHSLVDHHAEQNFDNRNRQYDGYDHHHQAARRHHRLGLWDGDDELRGRDLRDIGPALFPWCRCDQISLGFIDGHRVRRSAQIGGWHRHYGGRRRLGLVMVRAMLTTMATYRCCVPAMIRAMPIDVRRMKRLARFSLAHARL